MSIVTGYTKLFSSILSSSIWTEDDKTRLVWITMLALADRDGCVEAALPGLARMAGVTVEECAGAVEKLLSPDPHSRTRENGGRRIEEIDGGWRLLNHGKYRRKMSREDRKAYQAEWARNKRAKEKSMGVDKSTKLTQAKAKAKAKERGTPPLSTLALWQLEKERDLQKKYVEGKKSFLDAEEMAGAKARLKAINTEIRRKRTRHEG